MAFSPGFSVMGKGGSCRVFEAETKKRKLSDSHLVLDIPVLYTFEKYKLLLWLLEYQDDKNVFSIHTLASYTVEMMAEYPGIEILPTVIFTDRSKWNKDVDRELTMQVYGKVYFHFEYLFVKLFDYQARDYWDDPNPVVRILLPKMNYLPEERETVIQKAYRGLFELAPRKLFEKYVDFIDIYAEVEEAERDEIYNSLNQNKETMLAQYIRDKGKEEGILSLTTNLLKIKFQEKAENWIPQLSKYTSKSLEKIGERILLEDSLENIFQGLEKKKI